MGKEYLATVEYQPATITTEARGGWASPEPPKKKIRKKSKEQIERERVKRKERIKRLNSLPLKKYGFYKVDFDDPLDPGIFWWEKTFDNLKYLREVEVTIDEAHRGNGFTLSLCINDDYTNLGKYTPAKLEEVLQWIDKLK